MSADFIKASGLKTTKARVSIWSYFNDMPSKHHTAEDVFRYFSSKEDVAISLSTIYRVLNDFEQSGLLIRHHFEPDLSVYELASDDEHHDHMVCVACKKVVEFFSKTIESKQEEIALKHHFTLEDHRLILFGKCQDCAEGSITS